MLANYEMDKLRGMLGQEGSDSLKKFFLDAVWHQNCRRKRHCGQFL